MSTLGAPASLISRADVLTNLFLNPPETGSNGPENSVWSLGSQQQLRWKTNITNYDLMLYQQLVCTDSDCVNGPVMIKEGLRSDATSFIWRITTGSLGVSPTNIFFLMIRDVENASNEFRSSNLNFTGIEAPASTAPPARASPTTVVVISTQSPPSSPSATSKLTTTSTVVATSSRSSLASSSPATVTTSGQISVVTPSSFTLAPGATPFPPSLPSPSPSTPPPVSTPPLDTGLSTGTKVGLAIGIILLVVIAIFLGWYFGRRRKHKSKKSPVHSSETTSPPAPGQLAELHVPGWGEQKVIPAPFTPRELHGNGKFDAVKGVRELEAWDKPGELGDGRRSGIKSGVYELES